MDSKTVEISGRKYVLNRIPAFKAQKIAFHCFKALKDKDLVSIPDEVMLDLISYIGVVNGNGVEIRLESEEFIEVNIPDAGVLMNLEVQLIEYNFGFFFDGSLLEGVKNTLGRLLPKEKADTSKA